MNISFNFKNFEASDHLKEYAAGRFGKLTKFVGGADNPDLTVNMSVEKHRHQAEVVFNADNIHISAYEESEDMYSTIDLVLDKLEAQLRKMREKMKDRRRQKGAARMDVISFTDADGRKVPTIMKTDHFEPKPMAVEEAAMQLDAKGHEFMIFRNSDGDALNVIYRRKNGDYGLIDPGYVE